MQRLAKSTVIRGLILLPYLICQRHRRRWCGSGCWTPRLGIVNGFIERIGLSAESRASESALVIPTIALINVWRYMGYTALLVFAGLQTIPALVYEAASLDGAGESRSRSGTITLPLLRPVLALVLVITVTGSFQVFDTVPSTTQGRPGQRLQRHPVLHRQPGASPKPLRLRARHFGACCSSSLIVVALRPVQGAARPASRTWREEETAMAPQPLRPRDRELAGAAPDRGARSRSRWAGSPAWA